MKRLILVLALCVSLCGCIQQTKTEYETAAPPGTMTVVDRTTGYIIYKHDETGVHYICCVGADGRGICVMVNPDGTPYIG